MQAGVCQSSWGKRPGSQTVSIFFPWTYFIKSNVCTCFMKRFRVSYSLLLIYWFSNELSRLNLQCQTPGLPCVSNMWLKQFTPKENLYFYNPTPFCDPFQGNRLPSACFPFPFLLSYVISSIACFYSSLSASLQIVFSENDSHVNVFLMYLSGQVCSEFRWVQCPPP